MRKTYKYRLFPAKRQKQELQNFLSACRWVYNKTLVLRKKMWEEEQKFLSLYDTNAILSQWKKDKPGLIDAHSQCLQNAQVRVDLAFKSFFRRVKSGEEPGYPRFKSFNRYDSFTYPQSGFNLTNNGLKLSKIGTVKIKLHRPINGDIKTCTIRQQRDKWYACFSCEVEINPLPKTNKAIGVDVGLKNFVTFSNGEKIENPRFFKADQKALTRGQRKLSKQEKGTPERKKSRKVVARIHERIANRRNNFCHQESRKIVNRFDIICIENLNIKDMMSNHTKIFGQKLNRSIGDISWGQFAQNLARKAEEAARKFIAINPKDTSQICSRCGTIVKKNLSVRVHHCSLCGLTIDRDLNASINILSVGLYTLGLVPRSPRL